MLNSKRLNALSLFGSALLLISFLFGSGCAQIRPSHANSKVPTFAALADIQYGDKKTEGARNYRAALTNLQKCVLDLNQRDLAFVIQLGDTVDGYTNNPARSAKEHEQVLQLLNQQKAPVYHVLGNHCLRVGEAVLQQRYGSIRFYYSFTSRAAPGWRFVVLDGNDAGYGVVSEGQLAWFQATLARAASAGERVICFCHYALLKEAARNHRMAKPEPLLRLLDRYGCVVAWFAGHDHAGGYACRKGVHHLTLKGMVEAPKRNAYAFIELNPDHLQVVGIGAEKSRELKYPPLRLVPPKARE